MAIGHPRWSVASDAHGVGSGHLAILAVLATAISDICQLGRHFFRHRLGWKHLMIADTNLDLGFLVTVADAAEAAVLISAGHLSD